MTLWYVCTNSSHAITFTFRLMPMGNVWTPLFSPSYGLNRTIPILVQGWLWHLITHKVWYAITQRNQTKPINQSNLFFPSLCILFLYFNFIFFYYILSGLSSSHSFFLSFFLSFFRLLEWFERISVNRYSCVLNSPTWLMPPTWTHRQTGLIYV